MGASCTKAGREEAAFLKAAKDGDCTSVQEAILRDVEWACKVQTWNGQSVFHLAARYGRLDVLDTVVEAVRFNPAGPDKWKKLLRMGHSTDALLRAFANLQDARCQTPLHLACIYGHREVAERLLQLGATPWTWDELGGRTPLHYAASMGHVEVIQAIVSHNAPAPTGESLRRPNSSRTRLVDICNDSGYTPLHYAVWAGNAAAVRALTSYEASLSARNVACGSDWVVSCLKCTPLHLAAHKGSQAIVKLLLSAYVQYQPPQGADAPLITDRRRRDPRRHVNANRQLPYHVAVARNHNYLTEMLHPDVPFSFILSPAEMESRLYGVPKLAALAAKALQAKLVADIEEAVSAMTATTARSTATLSNGGGVVGGATRVRSGSLAVLSGAVVAAATGQAAGGATTATSAAQQVLAAATARLRSVNERSLHGGSAALQALEGALSTTVLPSQPPQQRPASSERAVAGMVAAAPVPAAVASTAAQVPSSTPLVNGSVVSPVPAANGVAGKGSSPPSNKSSATSAGDSEREALALGPAPDLAARPAAAGIGDAAGQPPALPLPPAPISPFLPTATSAAAAGGPAAAGPGGPAGGRPPMFNEAASAFALFAAEPFDEPAAGGGAAAAGASTGAQTLQTVGSNSISLAALARSRAQQTAGSMALQTAGSNSVPLAVLARSRMGAGAGSGKAAPSRSRSLRALLTSGKHRRSNTTVGGIAAAGAAAQQQTSLPRSEGPAAADELLLAAEDDALDDLDDILNAMQPPEDPDGLLAAAGGPPLAAGTAAAAEDAAPTAASSGRPSASQPTSLLARTRGTHGGGGSRPFWRRSSTRVAGTGSAGDTTPRALQTPEAGSPYSGSMHASLAASAALAAAASSSASTAPVETLPPRGSMRQSMPSLQGPMPPGVVESRPSTEICEVDVNLAAVRHCHPPAMPPPSAGVTPVDSMDDDTDALLSNSASAQSLRRRSISVAALARNGPEAVLPPPPPLPGQEQVDGAVMAMLASLVEAPQHVLRRYRLLQLTHGLDLEDLLRGHSEQAAAAAAVATGSARPSGAQGQLLSRTRSDARAMAASGPARFLIPSGSLQLNAAVTNGCSPPAQQLEGNGGGEESSHGGATAVAVAATAAGPPEAANTGISPVAVAGAGRLSGEVVQGFVPFQPSPSPRASMSPFAQEAGQSAVLAGGTGPASITGMNGAGGTSAGAAGASAAAGTGQNTNAVSANLAGQLLRTLSSAAASESGEGTCGVCFDQPDVLSIRGCGHRLCTDCSRELCKLNTFKPALCPFCRGMIGGFKYVGRS